MRAAAGQDDLTDPKRSRLLLVEAQRSDEVAREGLQLGLHRCPGRREHVVRQLDRRLGRRVERHEVLDPLGRPFGELEGACNRGIEDSPAPGENASELADRAVGDGERRAVVADRDDDRAGIVTRDRLRRRADGAEECKGF